MTSRNWRLKFESVAISVQYWQGDDVARFENHDAALSNGLAVTGN